MDRTGKDGKSDSTSIKQKEKGRLIVFEGPDGSGKRTQAKMLLKYLKSKGVEADYIEFPQYDSAFGSLVAKYLRGELGELDKVPAEIPSILFALDRYQFKFEIENILKSGKYLIANRYSESNLGFQAAKYSGKKKDDFISWLKELDGRMPRSDLVFYLHLPISHAQELIANRSGKKYLKGRMKDIHEQDLAYQQKVADTYLEIAQKEEDKWVVIECFDENGIRSKESVHDEIVRGLSDRFESI